MSRTRELIPAAVTAVQTALREGAAADLGSPTPCTDFRLSDLVEHYLGTTGMLAGAGRRGGPHPTGPAASAPWVQRLSANLDDLAGVWSDPAAWRGELSMGSHPMPAGMIGEMVLAEIVLHGWDVTRAAGVELHVPDAVAAELRRGVEETAELGRAGKAYGDPVPVPDDASDLDHALGASGRDPAWRP